MISTGLMAPSAACAWLASPSRSDAKIAALVWREESLSSVLVREFENIVHVHGGR